MISLSISAKNSLLIHSGFRDVFAGGYLWMYDGVRPVSTEMDVAGNLIATVTNDGLPPNRHSNELLRNGITFAFVANDGMLRYDQSILQTWHINVAQNGTPTWFRFTQWNDLPNTPNGERFDGRIGEDLILTKSPLEVGDSEVINSFVVYL